MQGSTTRVSVVPIDEIGVDARHELFVRPALAAPQDFRFIWRDASGIRWDPDLRALRAAEPNRWELFALFKQMVAAVRNEYRTTLTVTPHTVWSNVPMDLKTAVESMDTADQGRPV
jgi:hypothetical protein